MAFYDNLDLLMYCTIDIEEWTIIVYNIYNIQGNADSSNLISQF